MPATTSRWKTVILTIVTGVSIAVAFLVGDSVGQRSMLSVMRTQLDSIQGVMAFNRLLDERKLQMLLARGCVTQSSYVVDVAQDKDMELLSGFFMHGQLDAPAIKYIADRDPKLLGELKTFKSKYGNSWAEPECPK